MTQIVEEEWDPQGWWMQRADPATDINLLRFKPATRALLLPHTAELDRLQRGHR